VGWRGLRLRRRHPHLRRRPAAGPVAHKRLARVDYAYDNDGLLIAAQTTVDSTPYTLSLTRDPSDGKLTATALSSITTAQTYDGFGDLATFAAGSGIDDVYAYQITSRDDLGRILTKTETIEGVSQ